MKKCRQCSKPATLHITEVRKSEVQEIHLCESCAKEYLSQAEQAAEPASSSSFEFEKFDEMQEPIPSGPDTPACPNCGITFKEFRTMGRLGCPHDYVQFEPDLIPLLENIHGETQHCGKIPRRAPDSSRRQHQLIRLRSELNAAVREENYEEAARLRDEIESIGAEPGSSEHDAE